MSVDFFIGEDLADDALQLSGRVRGQPAHRHVGQSIPVQISVWIVGADPRFRAPLDVDARPRLERGHTAIADALIIFSRRIRVAHQDHVTQLPAIRHGANSIPDLISASIAGDQSQLVSLRFTVCHPWGQRLAQHDRADDHGVRHLGRFDTEQTEEKEGRHRSC